MSSYAKLANLDDDSKKGNSYSKLAALGDDEASSESVAEPIAPQSSPQRSLGREFVRQLGLTARAGAQAVAALPLAAMDAGVATRNLMTGSNYDSPSSMWNEALNAALPSPETKTEKVVNFVSSVVAGSKLPAPQIKSPAPANFVPPSSPSAQVLKESRAAGYVVPPTTASPNVVNKVAEGIAGKAATAQAASIKNQKITNDLARKALGLADGAPITPAALKGIRESAGKVYDQIGKAGEITTDAQYLQDLVQLGNGADEIAKSFPGANVGATKQVGDLVDSMLQTKFDSKSALQYLKELRKQASGNLSGMNVADPAKQALGMAQREAASILEEQIERHLTANGMEDIAKSFSTARRAIAVSHAVEKALNETTGNVIAGKLGQQLSKGKPLSGELETIARFSRAFPKAAKEITESMPGISPLDMYASGAASLVSGQPMLAAYPLMRLGVRSAITSPMGQELMTAPATARPDALTLGMAPSTIIQGAQALEQN